jgi:3-oxoacyl-[acyl-carrier protein] reductase
MSNGFRGKDFSDRVALVTGASRGIGRAVALRLADAVSAVAVHCRSSRKPAESTAEEIRAKGAESEVFSADLTDEASTAVFVRSVEERFGRIDILINNVGPLRVVEWEKLETEDWEAMWRGNLISSWQCMKAVLPGMRSRGGGRIVNLGYSRVETLGGFRKIVPYAAAKSALLILTRSAARAEGRHGVTVNMVSPGLIQGGILPPEPKIPAGRLGGFPDVAEAVAFLVSPSAEYITGSNLVVAGGWKL